MKKKNDLLLLIFSCLLLSCRHESSAPIPKVESLEFVTKNVKMKTGESLSVKVEVKPSEARKYANVTYTPSVEGYITVNEESNDGCVITAERGGTVVLVARAGDFTAYLEVKIEGDVFSQEPYIMVPTQVIEVLEGARKTAQVNLYNGSAVDQQRFIWEVEPGKDNIVINPTGNTVVVQGEKRGSQKIIVKHEKSQYDAEILVFVVGVNEQVKYITSGQNVITMTAGAKSHELTVTLAGGKASDISGFTFTVIEQNPCVDILPSNNSCSISAKWKGTAVIRITHPLAEYPLEVRVIVLDGQESYIELDKTFMLLDIGQSGFINAGLEGYYTENWKNDFSFEKKGDENCITIIQTNFQFYVKANETGSCIVEISNKNIQYGREALVVVRDPVIILPDEYYITTSQNVIQMEIGQALPAQLSIQLINGIEADKASFEWTVEDGSIISVDALDLPYGKNVNYLRNITNRAAEIKGAANTMALVTPRKVGSTKIVVEHPKSPSNSTVMVKVYPKGTFGNTLYMLGRAEGGLIKIDLTKQLTSGDTEVNLKVIQGGDASGIGKLNWEIKGRSPEIPDIAASVQDLSGLQNYIHGIKKGVNKLIAGNEDTLKYPFEATVMVGATEELAAMAVLYVDQTSHTVAIGQSARIPVLNSNMADGKPNGLSENDQYYTEKYDKTIVSAIMIKNTLLLQGLSEGTTTVTVGNRTGSEIIPVEIKVTVLQGFTSIDKPYMLTGSPNFIGLNWGNTNVEYKARLSGENMEASSVEKDRIKWSSSNGTLVRVTGNGETVLLTAGNGTTPSNPADMTGQANVTASHDKSINEKTIVVYVVPPGADPMKSVVLGIAKDHWLLKPNDEVVMTLLTNADESADRDIKKIQWKDKNGVDYLQGGSDSIIDLDYSGPTAMVRARAKGSTVITVTHPNKVLDLKIYISVSDVPPLAKSITLPGIVELIINENKIINSVTEGLDTADINKIEWSIDDETVASISGELPAGADGRNRGGKLFIKGRKRGQAWLTASQGELGYVKKILVVCASSYEDLMNTYIMACEESYFRLKKGDVKAVSMIYGSAGFPQSEKAKITWEDVEKNNVVKIHPPMYDCAEIEGINPGLANVRVNHPSVFKPVDLTFEVSAELVPGDVNYKFLYNGMMGLVVWKGSDGDPAQYQEPYTKTAALSISPAGLSYTGIEWADEEKPDKNIVKVTPGGSGNEYMITGRNKGQTYLKFSHKSGRIADDARILVYTAENVTELQQMFPIGVSKTNYLLNIGDPSETIKIQVPSQGALGLSNAEYKAKLDKISWDFGSNGNSIINYSINLDNNDLSKYKQEVTIQGKNTGNCFFDLKYEGKTAEKIYISVKAKPSAEMNIRIVTENIIGLMSGTAHRKTSIGSNIPNDKKDLIEWRSLDASIVDCQAIPTDKTSCYLNANKAGETEIAVSYGQIERFIKVYVCETDEDVKQYKAVNLDNRYYQIRRNDALPLTAFHAALPSGEPDEWDISFDNKVVELKNSGRDTVDIIGVNEGIAAITLSNAECKTDVRFMVEVNNTAPVYAETATEDWYMSAVKTVYALDPARTMDVTRVSVNGVRFTPEELAKIEWSVLSEEREGIIHRPADEPNYKPVLLTLNNRKGAFLDIMPNNKTGTVVLRASHARSVNDMDITVICGAEAVLANPVPYIAADRETVKLQLNQEAEITVSIKELYENYDIAQFEAVSDNTQKVTVQKTGNRITVKGTNFGQALVSVTHPKVPGFIKKIIVIVMAGDTNLVYLTTKQNFVVLEKGNYQAVETELVGYSDVNNRNYIWSTDDSDIISINDSGKSAVITAKNIARTAKIMVQHKACPEYPLFIYVRVTEKNTVNPVYITTPNNIAAIKEGAGIQVKANLANGGGHELSQFVWTTNQSNLIELNYSGDTALIKGLTPGTAQVNIWHPSSLNSINILIVVEPLEPNNGIYITTDSQLIEMTTAESQRLIKARLVGGNPEDIYGFQWQITGFSSILKQGQGQSYQPISILTNADSCYIQPVRGKYEGEATITISHPKTNYKLDIKVIIADATDIQFSQSYITVDQFEQKLVNITAPSNGALNLTVQQNSTDPVIRAYTTSETCVIEGVKEGTAIVRISNASGTKSDELIVKVNKVDLTSYAYINVKEDLLWTKTISETQVLNIQILGVSNKTHQQQLLNSLVVNIEDSRIIAKENEYSIAEENGIWTKKITCKAMAAGSSYIKFSINPANSLLASNYPSLKNTDKKVYFKVNEGDNIYSVDKEYITMYEGSLGEMITASIDTIKSGGLKASQIQWIAHTAKIENVEKEIIKIDQMVPPNDTTGVNIVSLRALEAGATYIEVKFGNITKIVQVTVAPIEYITVNPSNMEIYPGASRTFTITSSPNNKKIVWEANSNIGVEDVIYIRNKGSTNESDWMEMKDFTTGTTGKEIKITGSDLEGSVRITFTMVETKKQAMVTVNNVKNYYARWLNKSALRFNPGTAYPGTAGGNSDVRIYYECNPPADNLKYLSGALYGNEFEVEINKVDKYVQLKPIKNAGNTAKKYYPVGAYDGIISQNRPALEFVTEGINQPLKLPVYIYYDKINISWKQEGESSSTFDPVTYGIILDPGSPISIKMVIDDDIQNLTVSWDLAVNNGYKFEYVNSSYNGKVSYTPSPPSDTIKTFSVVRNKNLNNNNNEIKNPGSVLKDVVYLGTLQANYTYFNGVSHENFNRKFMLYTNIYN